METFGQALARLMDEAGLTRKTLAYVLSVTPDAVGAWLTGDNRPRDLRLVLEALENHNIERSKLEPLQALWESWERPLGVRERNLSGWLEEAAWELSATQLELKEARASLESTKMALDQQVQWAQQLQDPDAALTMLRDGKITLDPLAVLEWAGGVEKKRFDKEVQEKKLAQATLERVRQEHEELGRKYDSLIRDRDDARSDAARKMAEINELNTNLRDMGDQLRAAQRARDDARSEGQRYLTLLNNARAALEDTDFEVGEGQSLADRLGEMVLSHGGLVQEAEMLRKERTSAETLARGGWWSFAAVLVVGAIHWLVAHTGGAR